MPFMQFNIKKYFTASMIAQMIMAIGTFKSPILDLAYPSRKNWPMPVIPLALIQRTVKNVPVVKRGGHTYAAPSGSGTVTYIEPQPVILTDTIAATEMNNLKVLFQNGGDESVQSYIQEKIAPLREDARLTAEALAAQALTGSISYGMSTLGGGIVSYEIDYGTPMSKTVSNKWDASGTKIGDIKKDLDTGAQKMRESGYAGEVRWLANSGVYAALLNLLQALPNETRVNAKEKEGFIEIGSHKIYPVNTSYSNYGTDGTVTSTPSIAEKKIVGVPYQNNRLWYAALDSMNANLAPMPFYAHPEIKELGVDITAQSKPLPGPAITSTYWMTVLT